MADLGSAVLGRIFPANMEALDYALARLTPDHFTDVVQGSFFRMLDHYGKTYGAVFPGSYLMDLLQRIRDARPSEFLLYSETYNAFCAAEVSEDQFRYAVDALRDDYSSVKTGEAITTAMEILRVGEEVDGEVRKGWADAVDYLNIQLSEIDIHSEDTAPEGDIRHEGAKILAEYEERETSETLPGTMFGLQALDQATSGMQPGELELVAAFTNSGKSMLTAQLAWHACVKQGKPVFYATTETVRGATIRRILSRHSREPQFGYPKGLDNAAIKNGTLTAEEKEVFQAVVADFTTNSNYAPCYIAQLPREASLSYVERAASRVNRQGPPIGFLGIDSLQLLRSARSRVSEREEFNLLLRDAKVMAVTFDRGRGVPVVSPWQMREAAFQAAVKNLRYTLASLSDTSEAEKSPDIIVSLLRPTPTSDEALLQILKNRDGPVLDPVSVHLDYRCCYIGEVAKVNLASGASEVNPLADLFSGSLAGLLG